VVHTTSNEVSKTTRIEGEIERLRAIHHVGRSHVVVDEGGVGGGVVDHLEGVKSFVAGSRPIQDDYKRSDAEITGQKGYQLNYANLKAQCYYELADRVVKRKVSIPCADPDQQALITADLEQMKGKDADKDGKLKVTDKDEIREHINRSPDFSDAISLRMVFELEPEQQDVFVVVG
jgi:phage terminase large subunit